MQFIKNYALLVLFVVFLLTLSILDPFISTRAESEMENRKLAQHPKMTLQSLLAKEEKQKYSYKYEQYVNDQFVGRDTWITLKSVSESALGKIENNGIVYGKDKRMFEYYPATDERRLSMNIGFLTTFLERWKNEIPLTVAVIPNSYAIYSEEVPAGLQNVDQRSYIDRIYKDLPEGVQKLDLFPVLEQAAAESKSGSGEANGSAYYKTDHHWTTLGAYNAYRTFVESRGLKAVSPETLEPLHQTAPEFYGTYFSKCKLFSAVPDTIDYYDIPVGSMLVGDKEKGGLYETEKWGMRDKHAAFLWGNNDLTIIKSENNLNHQDGKTSRILLVKDSYGNSFAPFLTYSYDEVYVVDLRFLTGSMSELLSGTAFDDLLVLYNFMNFASDSNLTFLNR